MAEHTIVLGLGSNIHPEDNLPKALTMLQEYVQVVMVSTAWETPPVGEDASGPNFLNAVAIIRTPLEPETLKSQVIRSIETRLGRRRTGSKNAPRTIDLDILRVNNQNFDPQVWDLPHLALPLAELFPGLTNKKTGETLSRAAARLRATVSVRPRPDVTWYRSG